MLIPVALLAFFWIGQTPAAPRPTPPHRAAAAEHKAPAGPKSAAALQQDIEEALRAAPFASDRVSAVVSGEDITLSGEVRTAEHKGVATRAARKLAEKDGWKGVHVVNQIAVRLPGL